MKLGLSKFDFYGFLCIVSYFTEGLCRMAHNLSREWWDPLCTLMLCWKFMYICQRFEARLRRVVCLYYTRALLLPFDALQPFASRKRPACTLVCHNFFDFAKCRCLCNFSSVTSYTVYFVATFRSLSKHKLHINCIFSTLSV